MPNYLVDKVILPEYLIHEDFDIVPDMVVEVHIDACVVAHDRLDGHEVLVHPVEIALFVPDVTIHLLVEGAQILVVEFFLGLRDGGSDLRVVAHIHLLGIVGTAGKGRIDIYEVHLDVLVLEIGASREALAAQHHIVLRIVSHLFDGLHLVVGHAALDILHDAVVVAVAEHTLGAHKVVEQCLTLEGVGEIGDISDSHSYLLVMSLKKSLIFCSVFCRRCSAVSVSSR